MKIIPNGPLIADVGGLELTDVDLEVLKHPKLGGLILFSRNYESIEQLRALVIKVREVRPNLVICVDHEGGRVQRFREGFTRIPAMAKLGHLHSRQVEESLRLSKDIGWLLAAELVALDIDHSFAPILDLDDDKSQIIGDRAFSADALIATDLSRAFIEGMNCAGMRATAKHFPGHGGVIADSHLELPVDHRDYEQILKHDLVPFKALADVYSGVMTAHILFSQVDSQTVSFSEYWLKKILRQTLGFNGVVFSDDLSMKGAVGEGDCNARAEKALAAGCDVVLICNARTEAEKALEFLESNSLGEHGCLDSFRHTGDKKPIDEYRQRHLQDAIANL